MDFLKPNFFFLIFLFVLTNSVKFWAQKNLKQSQAVVISVTYAEYLGKTSPLRNLVPVPPTSLEKKKKNKANRKEVKNFIGREAPKFINPEALPKGEDPILQTSFNSNLTAVTPIEPFLNIDGMDHTISQGSPPDPSLDVGNDYIIQMVNTTFLQIRDKIGNPITDPISANTIWSQLGLSSAGDPIVLFDQQANRWIITEFPIGNQLLFAITETSDPLGSWMAWSFFYSKFS